MHESNNPVARVVEGFQLKLPVLKRTHPLAKEGCHSIGAFVHLLLGPPVEVRHVPREVVGCEVRRQFTCGHESLEAAERSAKQLGRGNANIEDQIRAAIQLIAGLEVQGDDRAAEWHKSLSRVLKDLSSKVLEMEHGLAGAFDSGDEASHELARHLISFLLTFASRTGSRERLQLFTTNYDRVLEYGCDLAGIRTVDRFVGALSPVFRSSRLDVDMHYNPPGIRGEPRYLEGVIRLTKLHGSLDWRSQAGEIRRGALRFGADGAELGLDDEAFESLIIYPNPAKDVETLEYPYAELFRDLSAALCRPNSVLVTYGYGFGDDHINRVIADMLAIPSTHLLAIAFEDTGDRLHRFVEHTGREPQTSLLIGDCFGDLTTLVDHLLPKPAIDVISLRKAELLRRRALIQEEDGSSGSDDTGEAK